MRVQGHSRIPGNTLVLNSDQKFYSDFKFFFSTSLSGQNSRMYLMTMVVGHTVYIALAKTNMIQKLTKSFGEVSDGGQES
jgi:hypothetical protein